MSDSGVLSSAGGQEARDRFAERLRRLRAEAGNPSFRVMAAKSRSVSHATLHEAAKGTRFPSWTTTQAFVEACGGDVEEWREQWCAALGSDAVASDNPEATVPGSGEGEDGDEPAAVTVPGPVPDRGRRRRRRVIAIVVGCGTLVGAGVGVSLLLASGGQPTQEVGAGKTTAPNAPFFAGDRSAFIRDVTIPDGTVVKTGQRFTKTWELRNAGAVHWYGRFLQRAALPADNGTCLTPAKVEIPATKPGARVRVSVPVTAPATPGACWVAWKMVDGAGRQLLPGARPVFFMVNVAR